MKSRRYKLIEQHIDSFPVLPATVSRVMEVTNNPESSAKDLMEVILPDQSISLTVLKIANSVLFGRPKKVDSVKLAITILGFNEVAGIAMSKAFINSFHELPRHYRPYVDIFWQHSFICGMAAKRIAKDLDLQQDIAFMSGLIHDVGKLVMLQTFVEEYNPLLWISRHSIEDMLEEEKRIFSFSHDEVGGQLLRKWHFPDTLLTAVSFHHHPNMATEEQTFAYIVQLADILSFYCCNQEQLEGNDIVKVVLDTLPNVQNHWKQIGLPVCVEAITSWFNWLLDNKEQGKELKNIYSV